MNFSWMAWTWPTAIFFIAVFAAILCMGIWEAIRPGGAPRLGLLRFQTTRGDRLFISLLIAAFVHIFWLAFAGPERLWGASILSFLIAIGVFSFV